MDHPKLSPRGHHQSHLKSRKRNCKAKRAGEVCFKESAANASSSCCHGLHHHTLPSSFLNSAVKRQSKYQHHDVFIICLMRFCWEIVCLVLHLETFFVRKEDVGRWGEEADAGLLDFSSSRDSPLQGAGLIIGRLLFFLHDLLPRWFSPCFFNATKF